MKNLLIDDCCMLMDVADITGYDYEELFDIAMETANDDLEGKYPFEHINIVHQAFKQVASIALEYDL